MKTRVLHSTIFENEIIAASGVATSGEIAVNPAEGFFNLYVEMSGNGTCKFEASIKIGGSDYIIPVEQADIVTAHTASAGAGADGKDFYSFQVALADSVKIVATETGGVDGVVLEKVIIGWQ
mgnify:CR=1 FL=1